jgi:hypothetical protein
LENLEKIRRTSGPNPATLELDSKKYITSSVGKSSKNSKESSMWCHNHKKHNTADCGAISRFKWQKKACSEAKAGIGMKALAFLSLFEVINALKRHVQLKPEKTARSKKRKAESILSTEINLTNSSDEGE